MVVHEARIEKTKYRFRAKGKGEKSASPLFVISAVKTDGEGFARGSCECAKASAVTGAACAGLLPHEVSLPARKLPTCNITPRVKRTSFPCPAHIRRTVQQRNNAHVRTPSKPKRDRSALSFERCRSVSFIFPGKNHAVRRADITARLPP